MGEPRCLVPSIDFPINNEAHRVRQQDSVALTLRERPDLAVHPDSHQSEDTDVSENLTVTCRMSVKMVLNAGRPWSETEGDTSAHWPYQ